MKIELYQIDAFTSRIFTGNPAAVCPLDAWIPDDILQDIARENNLSETAFFVREPTGYRIRWFTPSMEVDLCGHATLATGYVILSLLHPELTRVTFQSMSGPLTVTRNRSRLCLDFPARPGKVVPCPRELKDALGVDPLETLMSRDFMAVLDSEETVRALSPDMMRLAALPGEGVLITAPGTDCDVVSRCFFPGGGIPEDPVTGSAHCTIVPYWTEKTGKSSLFCRQISVRGGELWCELQGDRVEIAGECAFYLRGQIEVPLID